MEEQIIEALKSCFDAEEVEATGDTEYGLPVYDVDGDEYLVGTYDKCYDAAVEEAKQCFEDCFSDEDKVEWLKKQGWPGVDKQSVAEDCGDEEWEPDFDEVEEVMGFSWDFLKAYVDEDELGEYVVDCDGIANGLARYDGEEHTIDVNGETYYCYRTN